MSGRPVKPGSGNNKLMSRLAAKMGASSSKRQANNTSAGPAPKKQSTAAARKVVSEEAIAPGTKEKKDIRPIFELRSNWRTGIEPIPSKEAFTGQKAKMDELEGAEKELQAREMVLGAVKTVLETEKTGPSTVGLVEAVVEFVPTAIQLLFSDSILQALFELINSLEQKEAVPSVASVISTLVSAWPSETPSTMLLKLVVNDSCGKRHWSDHSEALQIYYSVISAFGGFTIPSSDVYTQADVQWAKKTPYDEASHPAKFDTENSLVTDVVQDAVETICQRANEDASKNLLRTMAFMMREPNVRLKAAKKMDTWLQNVKLQRNASDLMLFMACNMSEIKSQDSKNLLSELLLMQSFRSKQHLQVFQTCIEIFLRNCPGTMEVLVDAIMEADFSMKQKLPHTYVILQHLFSLNATEASNVLANHIVDAIDNSRSVRQIRAFIREFMKVALRGNDFQFGQFAGHMFKAVRVRSLFGGEQSNHEIFKNVTGLCAALPLAAAVQNVKEAVNSRRSSGATSATQGDIISRYMAQLQTFLAASAEFIQWAASVNFCANPNAYMDAYNTLLFIGGYRYFSGFGDNWPAEIEFAPAMKVIHECPLGDAVLLPILSTTELGYDRILTVLELLTCRALTVRPLNSDEPGMVFKEPDEIFDKLFALAVLPFADPEVLPENKMSLKLVYQRVWLIALKWALINRVDALPELYEYPLARMYFHMTLIDNPDFPLAYFDGHTAEEIRAVETAYLRTESAYVRANHVALRDSSDLALNQLCIFDPRGPPRSFPELTNHYFRFARENLAGVALCGVREPDVLRAVAKNGLADQALSTIKNAIALFPQIIETLPVVTLAQLFVSVSAAGGSEDVIQTLRDRLIGFSNDAAATEDIVDFLMAKLCDPSAEERFAALEAIQRIFGTPETVDSPINALANMPLFDQFCDKIYLELSTCVAFESDMTVIMGNISFIAKHMKSGDVHLIALNLTKIVERVGGASEAHLNVHHALLRFFSAYLRSLASGDATIDVDNEKADFGEIYNVYIPQLSKTVSISSKVLDGMMTLLCEGFQSDGAPMEDDENLEFLLDVWFGPNANGITVKRASDGESVPLLPDHLKRKMMSSRDERIVNAALKDLTAEQALNFVQSFALDLSACAKLLAIINADPDVPMVPRMRAVPFIKAYQNKGIEGAQKFLENLALPPKPEPTEDEPLQMSPFPTQEAFLPSVPSLKAPATTFDTPADCLNYLKVAVAGSSSPQVTPDWGHFCKALSKRQNAVTVISALPEILNGVQGPLPSSLVLTVLNLASTVAREKDLLPDFLDVTTDKRLYPYVKPLEKFQPLPRLACKPDTTSTLNSMRTGDSTNHKLVMRWISEYTALRSDYVDLTASDERFADEVADVFSIDTVPIRIVIDGLAQKASLAAATRTFDYLLDTYEPRAAPELVVFFVVGCVQIVNPCRRIVPSAAQATTLIDYVIAAMSSTKESPPALTQCIQVLQAVLEYHGQEVFESVLQSISDKIELSSKPPIDEPHLVVLNRLVQALGQKFVGCEKAIQRALKSSATFMSDVAKPRTIADVHKDVFFAIQEVITAVEAGDFDRVVAAISIVRAFSAENPAIVFGHIHQLTNRVAPILAMTKKEHREPASIKLLEFALETVVATEPHSYQNPVSLNLLLRVYLDFFHERVTYSSRFQDVFEFLCKAALKYILHSPTAAKELLSREVSFFKAMKQYYKFDSLTAVIRQLENAPRDAPSNWITANSMAELMALVKT
uniref:DUF3677 domain-containing protein n=1 Tax=Panagrellus redivivus TaxID=6233 RepID=A0A7E4URZ4_PANRE